MTEMYKIIKNKQDSEVTIKFNIISTTATRGNIHKICQDHVKYDLRKFSFVMYPILVTGRLSNVHSDPLPAVRCHWSQQSHDINDVDVNIVEDGGKFRCW